jgi:hypothetical protein
MEMNVQIDGYIEEMLERMKNALKRLNYKLSYEQRSPEEIWLKFTSPAGSTLTTTITVKREKKENIREMILNFAYVVLPRLGEGYYPINKDYSVTFTLPSTRTSIKIMFGEDADTVTILVGAFRQEPLSAAEIDARDVFDTLIDIVELLKLATKEV